MNIVKLPYEAQRNFLQYPLKSRNQVLKIYTNNLVIGVNTTINDFIELASLGYAGKKLNGNDWTIATDQVSGVTSIANIMQRFDFQAGALVTAYGVYIVDETTNALLFCQEFPVPVNLGDIEKSIYVTPQMGVKSVW